MLIRLQGIPVNNAFKPLLLLGLEAWGRFFYDANIISNCLWSFAMLVQKEKLWKANPQGPGRTNFQFYQVSFVLMVSSQAVPSMGPVGVKQSFRSRLSRLLSESCASASLPAFLRLFCTHAPSPTPNTSTVLPSVSFPVLWIYMHLLNTYYVSGLYCKDKRYPTWSQ